MCSSGHGYIEYGRYKNGKTVQPDARLENTAGNAGSSKYLFIYLTKAEPNSLNRSYHPHLPRFGGKKEIIEKISQSITEKNHHYRKTIAESLAGSTGKRPSAELRHECGGTHHPPQHFSSAFKIVTGIGRKGSKNPSYYNEKNKINTNNQDVQPFIFRLPILFALKQFTALSGGTAMGIVMMVSNGLTGLFALLVAMVVLRKEYGSGWIKLLLH